MSVKVSVVVPVFDPGPHIQPCIDSLLGQTLPAEELELIFVDDGSTDGTPALLDRLAATHPQVQVIHEPNSGWSGRPRNVGTDAATGEYVQYLDQDDWLGPEALQRLYTFATAHDSDVVIGKMVGIRRGVPRLLFERTRPHVSIHDSGIMDSLTPHKMFRRQFLLDQGIRFPEGHRRLEDHVFVVTAYFAAKTISVYADYDCYFHISREDQGNAGLVRIEPQGYYANLREALDVVDANTEPGPERDRIHRRWLRIEVLGRLRKSKAFRLDPAYRVVLFDEIHDLVVERFSPGVEAGLPATEQRLTAMIRAGDRDGVLEQLTREDSYRPTAALQSVRATPDGLELTLVSDLSDATGASVRPQALADGPVPRRIAVLARDLRRGPQHVLPITDKRWDGDTMSATTTVVLPRSGTEGRLSDGLWDIAVRYQVSGRKYVAPATRRDDSPDLASGTGEPGLGTLYWGKGGALCIDVGDSRAAGAEPVPERRPPVTARRVWGRLRRSWASVRAK